MSRMLRSFGIAAICVGFVIGAVAILLANDSAKDAQERQTKAMFDEVRRIRESKIEGKGLAELDVKVDDSLIDRPNPGAAEGDDARGPWPIRPSRGMAPAGVRTLRARPMNFAREEHSIDIQLRSGVSDAGQRESLGKFIENLKSEAAELEMVGKKEDAEQKRQVIRALEAALQAEASRGRNAASRIESKPGEIETVKAYQEFAEMVQRFNELMDQKRFSEAEILAKQARQLQPENPVTEAMCFKAKLAAQDWFRQHKKEQLAAQVGQLKAEVDELEKAGKQEAAEQKRQVIETLEAALKGDTASKQADSSNSYQRDDLEYFPAGREFKLWRQIEALEDQKARQQGKSILDPASATALGKIIDYQKAEAEALDRSGRKEDAAQKWQAIRILESVLSGEGPKPTVKYLLRNGVLQNADSTKSLRAAAPFSSPRPTSDPDIELQFMLDSLERSQSVLSSLVARKGQLSKDDRSAEALLDREIRQRNKEIEAQRAEIDRQIIRLRRETLELAQAGHADVVKQRERAIDMLQAKVRDADLATRQGGIADKSDTGYASMAMRAYQAILREQQDHWRALHGAAAMLKEAGLENQSRALLEEAAKKRDEYFRQRDHVRQKWERAPDSIGAAEAVSHSATAPPELHRTLAELRDQVRELRKEVGQLRELLEKKP